MPETGLKPLEELFPGTGEQVSGRQGAAAARERARMLRGWVHSGFNVHRGRRVLSREREDMERLAQYIIRSPFFGRKDAGKRAGPGFGIPIDPLPLRHETRRSGANRRSPSFRGRWMLTRG